MSTTSAPETLSPQLASFVPVNSRWHTGNLLAFSYLDGPTDFGDGLVARTDTDGLDFRYPARARVSFQLPSAITESRVTNDWFEALTSEGGRISGVLLDAYHLLLEGPCSFESASSAITSLRSGDRLLIGSSAHFRPELIESDFVETTQARLKWLSMQSRQLASQVSDGTHYTFMRALSQMKSQVCAPEGLIRHAWTTPDRWPHREMWLWDSSFHAIGWRHLDVPLAQQMIEAVLDVQAPSGFIPHRANPRNHSPITQPPVLALGVQLVFEKSGDVAWLKAVYPKLCAYVEWNAANRDSDGGGLLEWFIEETPECRSGESGMDNSSRFDAALLLDAPDFNSYQAGEYEILAEFADLLGLPEEAGKWRKRYEELCGLINEMLWSEELGLYCDRDPRTGLHTDIRSCAGFLPLLCGAPNQEQARRLAAHLLNPETFGTAFPIPSIAPPRPDSAGGTSPYIKDMWRGPTWININWLVARGLRRYGMHEAAERLRSLSLAELERSCEQWGTFFEYFDDRGEVEPPYLLRKGKCVPGQHPYQAIHDYGWSATLYVDWLLARD